MRRTSIVVACLFTLCVCALAEPTVSKVGPDLYAYISDNDGSANSTFLVGEKGILVVDTGLNAEEGAKLLKAIRKVSNLPVEFIVNTHYHPDHQGGNAVVGPSATVISTDFTRAKTLELMRSTPQFSTLRPAATTFSQGLKLHLDPYVAEIYFPGKAHTSGDALVYFPQQQVIATGDIFLNHSSPAMDQGSVANWIQALDGVLKKPLQAAVPGHFELATRQDVERFRNYLHDLYDQVSKLKKKGATFEQVKKELRVEQYKDFRQYPQYHATFADNAEVIYHEITP